MTTYFCISKLNKRTGRPEAKVSWAESAKVPTFRGKPLEAVADVKALAEAICKHRKELSIKNVAGRSTVAIYKENCRIIDIIAKRVSDTHHSNPKKQKLHLARNSAVMSSDDGKGEWKPNKVGVQFPVITEHGNAATPYCMIGIQENKAEVSKPDKKAKLKRKASRPKARKKA